MNAIKGQEQIVGLSMAIWDICIRRPVFTAMLLTAPLVMGLAGFSRLGVDLFPNVDVPVVVSQRIA